MAKVEDLAEAISDLLAKKEELRPIGKELIEELPEDTRQKIEDTLAEMTLDVAGTTEGYKVGVVAPDTRVAVPSEVAEKVKGNPEITAETLYGVPWAREWAEAIYRMATGKTPTKEEALDIIRKKLIPTIKG